MHTPGLTGITRPVWILGVVSFLADLSGEMVYPIIPLFLTGTLGAPVVAVGIIEGVAEGTANITKLITGRLSDRWRARKPFIVAGYGLGAVGKLILGLSPAWGFALVGRSADRFGKGVRGAPRDALLSDYAEDRYRGRVFGFHRAMDSLGAVFGPLLGLAVLALDGSLRLAILLAVVPGIVSVLALRWLPEKAAERTGPAETAAYGAFPRSFYLLLGAIMIFSVGNSSDAFLILRSKDVGLSTTLVVLAYVTYNVVYTALSYPAGVLSDHVPRSWLLVGGYLIFAAVYAGFAFVDTGAWVWPLFAVYGAYIAFTDGVSKALVSDLVPREMRSTAQGLFQGTTGLAALAASVGAGILWQYVSHETPFLLGASCAAVGALVLAGLTVSGSLRPHAR